jgi:electron transfer flavoprotein alpha subunit
MSGPILVLVEHAAGAADALSLEALGLARGIGEALGASVEAVVVGARGADAASILGGHGVATVHLVSDERLTSYAPDAWAAALAGLADARAASSVIGSGSDRGNEVLARLAARTGLPLAANVISARPGDPWRLTRQRWGGSLLEDATLDGRPALLTVAAHTVAIDERPNAPAPTVTTFAPSMTDADLRVRVSSVEPAAAGGVSLTDARVVVGGGRGVGSGEAFAEILELASVLGAAVGVSRAVTSAGWRPHVEQVGQTGARIAPDIYIACGISGAIQHIVGAKGSKRILAINTDADAPIMGVADYAVIGDLHAIVPAITAEIRRRAR